MHAEPIVLSLLDTLKDPVLGLTATEMGIRPITTLEDSQLTVTLCAGFPCALLQETFQPLLIKALETAFPNHQISVTIDHFIKAHRTQLTGKGLRGVKNTIAVASGKGGVGKSTVAINLAAALARLGARVGILDADIYGPSVPLMLGKVAPIELSGDRYLPVSAHGLQAMSIGYLTEGEPALIWRGPMLAKSLLQLFEITQWDELDYLFIDLPPGTGDIQLSLVQKIPLTAAIIVTTPQTVATLDAQKALHMFAKTNIDVLGIIENMSVHRCNQCGFEEAIFHSGGAQALCEQHQCNLLGQLPLDARIGQQCEQGIPTASGTGDLAMAFTTVALRTAVALAQKPLNYSDKFPNIVVEQVS